MLVWLLSCATSGDDAATAFAPAPARLHRLTETQYRNSVEDLLGVAYAGELPADYLLHGYATIGGSEATLSPLELEQVEAAAWSVAMAAVPDATARDTLVGCTLGASLGDVADGDDDLCLEAWLLDLGLRAWRRPVEGEEIEALLDLYATVDGPSDPTLGVQAVLANVLLSPHFVYRVETGEDDPAGGRRLGAWELAARLSYFLTDSTPDEALLLSAGNGTLREPEVLRAHAVRLLDSERGREASIRFADETFDLHELPLVSKDTTVFPELTDAARVAMREEVQAIFADVVLDRAEPVDTLFTTSTAWVNGALAPVYGVGVTGDELVPIEVEADRGGILGRAAWLTINSNATFNSPTHRGKWVRTRLLCQDIPSPPAGIPSIDEAGTEGTLRDRLERHMSDPTCNGCHRLMDPIGFGFEHYDPIGRRQDLDNGLPVDATGDLDTVTFDGAGELGRAIAAHPALADCYTRNLYRFATGGVETESEEPAIESITAEFQASGLDHRTLVLSIVLSDGFTRIGAPSSGVCLIEGDRRACATACGEGTETCVGGLWVGCDAPAPTAEECDGRDNDCDGTADEYVKRACEEGGVPGVQECLSEQWQSCETIPSSTEVCNGVDDDADGAIDEGLTAFLETVTAADLVASHEGCAIASDSESGACHAAIHRWCATTGCGVSGATLVESDPGTDAWALSCVDASSVVVTTGFSTLSQYHAGCGQSATHGPDCNAAINRYCAAQGYGTGFGPVEHSGDTAVVTCTPTAAVFETSYTTLVAYDAGCDGSTERMGTHCHEAFHDWCQAMGYRTGFGPLENSGDVAYAACVGAR